MEFFSSNLRTILNRKAASNARQRLSAEEGALPLSLVLHMVAQVATGLQYLHESADLAHCDVKCENLFVAPDGMSILAQSQAFQAATGDDDADVEATMLGDAPRIVLGDFGEAKPLRNARPSRTAAARKAGLRRSARFTLAPPSSSRSGSTSGADPATTVKGMFGTLEFAAPEVVARQPIPLSSLPATDVWSLGMVLFEMLTLEVPYRQAGVGPFQVAMLITGGTRPAFPSLPLDWLPTYKLFQSLTTVDPADRPKAQDAKVSLRKLLFNAADEEETGPPDGYGEEGEGEEDDGVTWLVDPSEEEATTTTESDTATTVLPATTAGSRGSQGSHGASSGASSGSGTPGTRRRRRHRRRSRSPNPLPTPTPELLLVLGQLSESKVDEGALASARGTLEDPVDVALVPDPTTGRTALETALAHPGVSDKLLRNLCDSVRLLEPGSRTHALLTTGAPGIRGSTRLPLLHQAAAQQDPRALSWWLNSVHGLDVNCRSADGQTPLHAAIAASSAESVRLLLRAGCDASVYSNDGITPIMQCLAVEPVPVPIVFDLLAGGASVAVVWRGSGDTLLHQAVRRHCRALLVPLLRAGVPHTLLNAEGQSAADLAKAAGQHAIASMIVSFAHEATLPETTEVAEAEV
jgi:serine/threonine protein kinase